MLPIDADDALRALRAIAGVIEQTRRLLDGYLDTACLMESVGNARSSVFWFAKAEGAEKRLQESLANQKMLQECLGK